MYIFDIYPIDPLVQTQYGISSYVTVCQARRVCTTWPRAQTILPVAMYISPPDAPELLLYEAVQTKDTI